MFFQIATSPKETVRKQQLVEETPVLKLSPFSPIPKIFFENVAVGDVETKKIIIKNTNPFKTKLTVTKLPSPDQYVTLSWSETELEAKEEKILEIKWAPKQEGGWREIMSIVDNRNINRNVPVVFKSVLKKGKRRTSTNAKQTSKVKTTVVAAPAVKKFRSPKITKNKRSPLKVSQHVCSPKSFECDNCQNNIHVITCSPIKKKTRMFESNKENCSVIVKQKLENISPILYHPNSDNLSYSQLSISEKFNRMEDTSFFSSPTSINFKCGNILQTPIRRETYAINRKPLIKDDSKSPDDFNDSLELEKKLDNLEFTPEASVKSYKSQSTDSLVKKFSLDSTPDMYVRTNNYLIKYSPEIVIKNDLATQSNNDIIKKNNLVSTPETFFTNRNRTCDDYLVQKLLSDSYAFTSATVTKKPSNFLFTLNDTEVIDEIFVPVNCTTEAKISEKVNRNNSSTPKELFRPNSTFDKNANSPGSMAHNLSSGTYSISNISSSSTYAILSPEDSRIQELMDIEKHSNYQKICTSSPVLPHSSIQFHATSNYLNFSGINAKTALSCITEEEQQTEISMRNISIRSDLSCSGMKRKLELPETVFTVSPPKRAFIKPKSPAKYINTTWSKKLEKTEKIRRKSLSNLRLNLSKSSNSNVSNKSTASVSVTQTSCNIDPFLIAAMYNSNTSSVNSTLDPFISSTLYYDETWLDKQMKELKKWLNALLTPPSELATKAESKKVDIAKLWQDCSKKDLIYAPTKEKVSSNYHTNNKLEILRKSAKNLFHSLEIRNVLSKVTVIIENKQLAMREDKNLHLDVGLQSHILTLLLCYNPLWLRIGLETIYNESIPLDSNSDLIGLSTFVMLRFFRCPDLMPKNKQSSHMKYLPAYAAAVKKFTLKKFLMLIYFLDQAKTKKLISHDPCLFCRDAPIKESKEILLSLSRELLSAVGDITKFLRRLGYEVSHKQSYIDEFDYAVKNLGIDLRDGIRLTKVMEIILLRTDLTNQLRGPAISRLQKIHNVKLALDSLMEAGYNIAGEITSKDIVDGHREKTLSLLWQIIYKFQAPRFTKAATTIQLWWKSLSVAIKRRILDRPRQLKINSTVKIQRFYRLWKLMLKERAQFLLIKKSVITIEKFTRSMILMKQDKRQFLLKKQSVIIIQQRYRAQKLMKERRNYYLEMKKSAIVIQRRFRATYMMKKTREDYLKLKNTVIKLQRNFRSKKIVKEERSNFLQKKNAVVVIQRCFMATIQMKKDRKMYLHTRTVIIKLQQRFRATLLMRQERSIYQEQRKRIILLQQTYRANILMKKVHKSYLDQREAAVTIQQKFRANKTMKQARENYLLERKSAIIIQQHFKAHLQMKKCRESYLKLKKVVTYIQQTYRANKTMIKARNNYVKLKNASVLIQRRFRANVFMQETRDTYLRKRKAIIHCQQKYRAKLAMKREKYHYLLIKKCTIIVQCRFRANLLMKKQQQSYLKLKGCAIIIQRKFRANVEMKIDRENYLTQRKVIVKLQQRFRAKLALKKQKKYYNALRNAAINIQRRYRANKLMKIQKLNYLQQKKAAIIIQVHYKAYLEMNKCRQHYLEVRKSVIVIQTRFRAKIEMKKINESVTFIQTKFRAKLLARQVRKNYLQYREAIIKIQQIFRANILMQQERQAYLEKRRSIVLLQQKYRATTAMRQDRENYLKTRHATIALQQHFRANVAMKNEREKYLHIRKTVIFLQERFRVNISMRKVREDYLQKKRSVIVIQQRFRAYLAMKTAKENYVIKKEMAVIVQRQFRANLLMKKDRKLFLQQKSAAVKIQRWYRNIIVTKKYKNDYLLLKKYACTIQQKFREKTKRQLEQMNKSAIIIQKHFRRYVIMKNCRTKFLSTIKAITTIQTYYKNYLIMKKCRQDFLQKKEAAITIQRYFKAVLRKRLEKRLELNIKCVIKIQSWLRMHHAKKQLELLRENETLRILNNSAAKIQATWWGYKIRKTMSKKMALIRKRSQDAANNASREITIGQRYLHAVDVLMYHTDMRKIIIGLTILDFTTHLAPRLFTEKCHEVTERLYILSVNTNRSVPDKEVSVLCISILINLYKFQPTSDAVWKEQYIEGLLLLLLHWSDKDGLLFPYLCTLMWLFAQNPEYNKVIRAENNAAKILIKSYHQCERKQKMLTRMRNAPATILVKGQKDVLPSLVPDWGIFNADRPRVFMNPVFAIKCLLKKLNIALHM